MVEVIPGQLISFILLLFVVFCINRRVFKHHKQIKEIVEYINKLEELAENILDRYPKDEIQKKDFEKETS